MTTQLSRVERKRMETKKRKKKVAGTIAAAGVTFSISAALMNSVNAEDPKVAPTHKAEIKTLSKEEYKSPVNNLKEVIESEDVKVATNSDIKPEKVAQVHNELPATTDVKHKTTQPEVKVVSQKEEVEVPVDTTKITKEVVNQNVEKEEKHIMNSTQAVPTKQVKVVEKETIKKAEPIVQEQEPVEQVKPVVQKLNTVEKVKEPVNPTPTPKPIEKIELKEMLGSVTGLADQNALEMDVMGDFFVFNANGNEKIQNEIAEFNTGDEVVVRYVETEYGQKLIKDLVKVYDKEEGDLSLFVECDFFESIDPYSIKVYKNNKPEAFNLSSHLSETDLESQFSPGTHVMLALVKTKKGLIVENISEI